jgi:hypothetical protein
MILTATRSIGRPAAEVFTFLADAANNPRWQKGMKRCEWVTPGPIAVGSQYRQEASFLGRPVVSVFGVVEFAPGSRIVIETIESTFPIRVERSVAAVGPDSCRVSAEITGGPKVPRFAQGMVAWPAQRSVKADYDRLVGLLEGN